MVRGNIARTLFQGPFSRFVTALSRSSPAPLPARSRRLLILGATPTGGRAAKDARGSRAITTIGTAMSDMVETRAGKTTRWLAEALRTLRNDVRAAFARNRRGSYDDAYDRVIKSEPAAMIQLIR